MGDSWDLSANAAGYPEETNCNQPCHRMEGRYYLKLQDEMLEFLSSRTQVERSSTQRMSHAAASDQSDHIHDEHFTIILPTMCSNETLSPLLITRRYDGTISRQTPE